MRLATCYSCETQFEAPGKRGPLPKLCAKCWDEEWRAHLPTDEQLRAIRSAAARAAAEARWASVSPQARSEHAAKLARARWGEASPKAEPAPLLPCLNCGDMMTRRVRRWQYCSKDECRLRRNSERMKAGGWTRSRRDIIKSGRAFDNFADSDIFDRDGWICGICDEPVSKTARWPDGDSASLDHVQPLSLGGEHTRDNVRCSHLRCNVKRGNTAA